MKSFNEYHSKQTLEEQTPAKEGMNVTNIVHPSFAMCPPFNLHVFKQNNFFAKKYAKETDFHLSVGDPNVILSFR